MNKDMQIIREVSAMAEAFYEIAEHLGDHAAYAFQSVSGSERNNHRSQMTGLENIAESAFKTTDILDYIKKQIARHEYWRQGFPQSENPNEGFGESLKKYLETDLRAKRDTICSPKRLDIGDKTDEDKQRRRHIYLLLMRQFIRQMVIEYEYTISQSNVNRPDTGNRQEA